MSVIERVLAEVAEEVAWMVPPPVFIGGATVGLFLDDFGRRQLRPTKGVDCIVPTEAMEAVAGHLPRGGDVSARLRKVRDRMAGLARG